MIEYAWNFYVITGANSTELDEQASDAVIFKL